MVQRLIPTLDDVARHANVSTATVSRCLNLPDKVSENTRERVLQAVAELGYAPNFGARAMVARRTNTIGAIIPTMENAIFSQGLQAFQQELYQRGYQLLVASSSYQPEIEDQQIRALIARGADGLLLIGHDRNPETLGFLRQRGVPVVVAWSYDPAAEFSSVGFDNCASMQAMAQRVIGFGHRQIAVITARLAHNDRARGRVEGIRAAAQQACIPEAEVTVIETDYGISQGADAFARLMAHTPRPTVVMCVNDVLAVGAIRQARHMGLRVPQDMSITGFDDIELAKVIVPELTTVHVPHQAMGRAAAERLVRMVEDDLTPRTPRKLETYVVMRDSLGPAPGIRPVTAS